VYRRAAGNLLTREPESAAREMRGGRGAARRDFPDRARRKVCIIVA
jgi:hypothetical protein